MITRIPPLSIIVAVAANRVIGTGENMPWHIPEDLKWFKKKTMGHCMIMGRKTLLSFPKYPLPGRKHIVLSRAEDADYKGCTVVGDVRTALNACRQEEENFIIGGAQVYEQFLPLATKIYWTRIDKEFEGSVLFPELDMKEWEEIESVPGTDPERKYDYHFITLRRRNYD